MGLSTLLNDARESLSMTVGDETSLPVLLLNQCQTHVRSNVARGWERRRGTDDMAQRSGLTARKWQHTWRWGARRKPKATNADPMVSN